MSALVRARGTPLWVALYALGLLCVFSFVLFEVLDVDGSDFDATPSRVAIKLAESPHEALRRGVLGHGAATLACPVVTEVVDPSPEASLERRARPRAPIRPASCSRAALPRALLGDVPPSA